ncbi:hypothetical protein [Virgibacillus sp. YIM 98842]|uniref:hypothetical protein n=1 Tax=Virgibacillus sp. YIM 98842 TaxID=2663533 RepID=UPI0013DA6433|nr:hypothetical protein [Virgibacillus sp. YIM 98842]
MMTDKELEKAQDKAYRIFDLMGVTVTVLNEDGSTTTQKPKQRKDPVHMSDIVRVILE